MKKSVKSIDKLKKDIPFCKTYIDDKLKSKGLGLTISITIIAVNYFLKDLIIRLIIRIRHNTQSKRLTAIVNGVLYAQFFNTGILLTLVNANMHGVPIFGRFVKSGKFYDYTPLWYSEIGYKIV